MSNTKLTTTEAVTGAFEGQFRRRFLRQMWFPIVVTIATMSSPFLTFGFTSEVLPHVGNGFLFALVFWGLSVLGVKNDIVRAKYSLVVDKMDAVLENVDAHWTWCEDTQSYAVHFVEDPHTKDSEPEDPSADLEVEEK